MRTYADILLQNGKLSKNYITYTPFSERTTVQYALIYFRIRVSIHNACVVITIYLYMCVCARYKNALVNTKEVRRKYNVFKNSKKLDKYIKRNEYTRVYTVAQLRGKNWEGGKKQKKFLSFTAFPFSSQV